MQTLLNLVSGFLNGIRSAVGLVLPIFSDAADFRNWPRWVRVLLGLALLAFICVGAHFLQKTDIFPEKWLLRIQWQFVRDHYLIILVLLVVLFSWLAWIFWKLLTQESEAAEFPDILDAWSDAMRRLASGGMRIGDAPLFLVLGRPAAGTDALILSAGVSAEKGIIRAPSTSDPPLRVYAWNEAIFVVCPGASAWGALCGEMAGQGEASWAGDVAANAPGKTLSMGQVFGQADPITRAEMDQLMRTARERDLTPEEQNRLRQLAEDLSSNAAPAKKKLAMPEDVQNLGTRRLRYLCKLIRRERMPWCPINGMLVLLPWEATASDESVAISCTVLKRDLTAARDALQMLYPTYGAVCDLETVRGFSEFRSGFPSDLLKQRIGQRLPLAPDVDEDKVPLLLEQAAQWIGLSVLPAGIVRFLKLEHATGPHNRNLYLLLRGVFERGPRLAKLLARGIPPVGGNGPLADVPMFGGCYLAATGKDGQGQAFVPGIFERVIGSQDAVSWSPEAEASDARLNRLTLLGYIGLLLLIAAVAGALILLRYMK